MDAQDKGVPRKMVQLAQEFKACRAIFSAMGDENRQQIAITLMEHFGGMRVGEITKYTHLSRPAVSHHLRVLKDAGIIAMYKKGTMNFYHMSEKNPGWKQMTMLIGHLNELLDDISAQNGQGVCFPSQET